MGPPAPCNLPVWKQCECVIPARVCIPGAGILCCQATQCVRVCPLCALSPAKVSEHSLLGGCLGCDRPHVIRSETAPVAGFSEYMHRSTSRAWLGFSLLPLDMVAATGSFHLAMHVQTFLCLSIGLWKAQVGPSLQLNWPLQEWFSLSGGQPWASGEFCSSDGT